MIFFLLIFVSAPAWAQSPSTSLQLQRLIEKSERQIEALNDILKHSKRDTSSLEETRLILEKLTEGLDQSIESFQNTEADQKMFTDLQASRESKEDFASFQKRTMSASGNDYRRQVEMQKALSSAKPGVIHKIQAQTQLNHWQTDTRLSVQMTELLETVRAIHEELKTERGRRDNGFLQLLVKGAELQNENRGLKRENE